VGYNLEGMEDKLEGVVEYKLGAPRKLGKITEAPLQLPPRA
jgi:hypothetical protein